MTKPSLPENIEKELIAITQNLLTESGIPIHRHIKLDASLSRHLSLDSLGRAELFNRIEKKFGIQIPDRLLAEAETLNDIATFLSGNTPHTSNAAKQQNTTLRDANIHLNPASTQTLVDVLLLYAEKTPDKAHVYFHTEESTEEVITYKQLLTSALRVANGLREQGLKEGETVAIMQPTQPAFFYIFFGTLLAGGIPVPIYPPFRARALETYAKTEATILNNAQVRILVTFDRAERLSRLLQGFVPSLRLVTTIDGLMQPQTLDHFFKPKTDSFAFIQYTSGSTADPKGVLLSHQNLLANIRAYGESAHITPHDVVVSWLPLYHDMGLIGMWLGSLYFGVPLVLMTPFSFLNHPERWLWAIHRNQGTCSAGPNFAYDLCVRKITPENIEGLDLSSWRIAANGAEKIYPHTLRQFAEKFAPYGFNPKALLPVYGLAESTVALTVPPLDRGMRIDKIDRKQFEEERKAIPSTEAHALEFVGCGLPLKEHEVRIVDDENNILPERHVGNLQFRGPSCMQGYYNNPRATAAIYNDGWMDAGDLAYIAEGEVFITGRRKDLIIKAGRNLYPVEIEELVGDVPDVRKGCVVAFAVSDDKKAMEQLIVVAETREKNKAKREAIISKINEVTVAALDMAPDQVVLVAPHTVPKTSSGKLQRAASKKLYLNGKLGRAGTPPWLQIAKLGISSGLHSLLNFCGAIAKSIYTAYIAIIFLITLLPVYGIVKVASRNIAAKTCQLWTRFLRRAAFCPLHISGESHLYDKKPVIYTINHASYLDAVIALSILPIDTRMVGKKELFSVPILRTFARKLDMIPIDRIDLPKGIEDTQRIKDVLQAGHPVLIFPEGTFGYAAGLRPFRLGAFKIAAETHTPICPIAFQGTRTLLRDDEKRMRPGKLTVTACSPIESLGSEWGDITRLRDIVRAEITKYCGEPSLDFIAAQTIATKPPKDTSH